MDKPRWATRIFKYNFLIMKITLELFGASRDFSNKDFLEFKIDKIIEIKDLRKEIIIYLDKNFKGNENYKKIVNSSSFCSEDNNIINDNYKILKVKNRISPIVGGYATYKI